VLIASRTSFFDLIYRDEHQTLTKKLLIWPAQLSFLVVCALLFGLQRKGVILCGVQVTRSLVKMGLTPSGVVRLFVQLEFELTPFVYNTKQ